MPLSSAWRYLRCSRSCLRCSSTRGLNSVVSERTRIAFCTECAARTGLQVMRRRRSIGQLRLSKCQNPFRGFRWVHPIPAVQLQVPCCFPSLLSAVQRRVPHLIWCAIVGWCRCLVCKPFAAWPIGTVQTEANTAADEAKSTPAHLNCAQDREDGQEGQSPNCEVHQEQRIVQNEI